MILHGKEVPVLVMHRRDTGYSVLLALQPKLRASHERFEKALHNLRQAVHKTLEESETGRDQLTRLLYTAFSPECRLELIPLDLESGSLRVHGLLAALHFTQGTGIYTLRGAVFGF